MMLELNYGDKEMRLQTATIATIDRFWADFFGCTPDIFTQDATIVVPHAGLGDYHGLWLFRRNQALIVSLPPSEYTKHHNSFAALTSAAFDDQAALTAILGSRMSQIIGPAWIGYADQESFQPNLTSAARLLTPADDAAYRALRSAVSLEEWEHGGSAPTSNPLAGTVVDDTLVALAGYERWGEAIAHVSIVCHPGHRGRGYSRSAVSLITQVAFQRGLIPQYRTLRKNIPSMHIAKQLGYAAYADQVAIRLK